MARPSRYSADFRARAMRLVVEARPDHETEWAAITSLATKLGVSSETLRKWVRQAQVDDGQRPGTTWEESAEVKRLRQENSNGPTSSPPTCAALGWRIGPPAPRVDQHITGPRRSTTILEQISMAHPDVFLGAVATALPGRRLTMPHWQSVQIIKLAAGIEEPPGVRVPLETFIERTLHGVVTTVDAPRQAGERP